MQYKLVKNIAGIIVIFSLLFNIAGYLVIFKTFQYQAKKEIKQLIFSGMDRSELELIKVSFETEKNGSPDFRRIHEKEFVYKNKLYDIVEYEVKNDTTYYYCINDEKEEKLFSGLKKYFNENEDKDSPAHQNAKFSLKHLVKDYFFNDIKIKKEQRESEKEFNEPKTFYTSIVQPINSPPPRSFS